MNARQAIIRCPRNDSPGVGGVRSASAPVPALSRAAKKSSRGLLDFRRSRELTERGRDGLGRAGLLLREVAEVPYAKVAHEESEDDRIDNLGHEIAVLAAQIHAATHRLLVLIAEFDRLGGWERWGYADCAHWLSVRTGVDLHTAREK